MMKRGSSKAAAAKPAEPAADPSMEKEGWLSLQGAHGTARLVKAVSTADTFASYSSKASARAPPQSAAKSTPKPGSSDQSTNLAGSAAQSAGSAAQSAGSVRSAAAGVGYRRVDAPHPEYKEARAVSSEAVAHRVSFELDPRADTDSQAVVSSSPVPEVAACMGQYLDSLAAKSLGGSPGDSQELGARVAENVAHYCAAVTAFPAVSFNVAALGAVSRLVSGLGALDAQSAEQLKVRIAKAQERAQKQSQLAFTPTDSSAIAAHTSMATDADGTTIASTNAALTSQGEHYNHTAYANHGHGNHGHANHGNANYGNANHANYGQDAPAYDASVPPPATASPPISTSPFGPKSLKIAQSSQGSPAALMLEPGFANELADQIAAFHRRMWQFWSPVSDASSSFHTQQSSAAWRTNPLVFDRAHPHFSSSLVAQHVSSSRSPFDARAKLVDKWILVAKSSRQQGDGVGWIAIVATSFETPISRLDKVWDQVTASHGKDGEAIADWGHESFESHKRAKLPFLDKRALRVSSLQTGKAYAKEDVVPYFGDAIITDGLPGDVDTTRQQLERVNVVVSGWLDYLETVTDETPPCYTKEDPAYQCSLAVWAQQPTSQIDAAALSRVAEPKSLGHYSPHFYSQTSPSPTGGSSPVSFTTVSPNFRSFPRHTSMLASSPKQPVTASAANTARSVSNAHPNMAGNMANAGSAAVVASRSGPGPNNGRSSRRSSSFPPAGPPPQTTGFSELDFDAREQLENTASAHVLAKSIRDSSNVGTDTIDGHADIVFKAFLSDDADRRSSRTSSIIENSNSSSRRQSYMAGQPLPDQPPTPQQQQQPPQQQEQPVHQSQHSASRSSSAYSHPMREVVVKSASMVRLVDASVSDASAFGRKDLKLDLDTHIATSLATYRSFCSPIQSLDMSISRVQCARGAANILATMPSNTAPAALSAGNRSWRVSKPDEGVDSTAVRIISAISLTMNLWVSDYYFDFMDDAAVMEKGMALIVASRSELTPSEAASTSSAPGSPSPEKAAARYPDTVLLQNRQVTKSFSRKQYSICTHKTSHEPTWSPQIYDVSTDEYPNGVPESPVTNLAPDGGIAIINGMIDELDTLVSDAFSRITMVDWMKSFEVSEQQIISPTGLYSYRTSPLTSESDVLVQDVFSWLRTSHEPTSKTRVLDQSPEPIVALVRLQAGLVSYFSAQVADPSLTHMHERVERMVFILKMLGVSRARMQYLNFCASIASPAEGSADKDQNIPSFLEQALISAILSPESRAYSAAWSQAGKEVAYMFPHDANEGGLDLKPSGPRDDSSPNARNVFVPVISVKQGKPITVCLGWTIERSLEIVGCVPNLSVDNPDLINFDKRRYAFNSIKNIAFDATQNEPVNTSPELAAKYSYISGEAARNISVNIPLISRKLHKESVAKQGRVRQKVFTDVVAQELEKVKLEARMYEKLERSASAAQAQAAAAAAAAANAQARLGSSAGGPQSFYGLPSSQSSTSIYSKRISRLIPSISASDVSSCIENSNNNSSSNNNNHVGNHVGNNANASISVTSVSNDSNSGSPAPSNISTPEASSGGRKPSTHGHRKSRLGGFFRAVRPLSVLGSSASSLSNSHSGSSGAGGGSNSHGSSLNVPGSGSTGSSSGKNIYNHSNNSGGNSNSGYSQNNGSNSTVYSTSQQSIGISAPSQATMPNMASLYSHSNLSASSMVSFQDERADDASSTGGNSSSNQQQQQQQNQWVSDSSVDLSSQLAVSSYSADDWNLSVKVDVINFNNVELRAPNFVVITHRSGPKPETLVLRSSSVESAQDWYSKTSYTMERKLRQSTKVFGVPSNIVAERENVLVPAFLETLLHEIENRGSDEVGVYRISGSLAAVNGIKQWFDLGNKGVKVDDPRWSDVNAIAGCIKSYLRESPQPLMTQELLPEFIGTVNGIHGVNLEAFKATLEKSPPPNYETIKRLSKHSRSIVDHSNENKMNMQNIAIVFSVNFLPPVAMAQMGSMQQSVTALVQHSEYLFPDTVQ